MNDGSASQQPSLRTLAMPANANANGDIFGGWLMSQMDIAGGTYAYYIARGRVATVGVEAMTFHLPVYIGDEVSCYCDTVKIGNTSITVDVDTWVRRRADGQKAKVTSGRFTFVAIDDNGHPRPIDEKESG